MSTNTLGFDFGIVSNPPRLTVLIKREHIIGDTNLLRGCHFPRELTLLALQYFDRAFSTSDCFQRHVAEDLNDFFSRSDVQQDFETVPIIEIENCITNIGRVFFLNGLDNVRFYWFNEQYRRNNPGARALTTLDIHGDEAIFIDTQAEDWTNCPREKRWKKAREHLLHEGCHVLFLRFVIKGWPNNMLPDGSPSFPLVGHDAAWHILAKAVEDRASSELGWDVDLSRDNSLANDFMRHPWPIMTSTELKHAFGERIKYTEPVTSYSKFRGLTLMAGKLLIRDDMPYFAARLRTKISRFFAKLKAKLSGHGPPQEENVFEEYWWREARLIVSRELD